MNQEKRKICVLLLSAAALAFGAQASWYWPFGSDDDETATSSRPRLSTLMAPASVLIDEASDLAEDGKGAEAVEKYREALAALDRIEAENADLVDKPEFATLRNKRAYVNATIDSLLLKQVRENARAVAVSETTVLERKLAEEKARKRQKAVRERRKRAMRDLAAGDCAAASLVISEMLADDPKDAAALNLKAALETLRADYKAAEKALDLAIAAHPRSYQAYYNMAKLILEWHPANKAGARRYYEAGRDVGGPRDAKLEEAVR